MSKFLTLLGREIKSYFYSPIAYVVLTFFLLITGFNFYVCVSLLNQGPTGVTVLEAFFNTVTFWWSFVLIFPLITMRTFSEEFKMGTVEPLMTAPVGDWQVVLAKFFGALFFYVVLWLPSLAYFWLFQKITLAEAAYAPGAFGGSYLLLLLLGMFYLSIGCFASVLTSNQIIAAVICFCAVTLTFFSGLLWMFMSSSFSGATRDLMAQVSAIEHMMNFSRGVVDTRPIAFYLSMTCLMLFFTHKVFESRKWRA